MFIRFKEHNVSYRQEEQMDLCQIPNSYSPCSKAPKPTGRVSFSCRMAHAFLSRRTFPFQSQRCKPENTHRISLSMYVHYACMCACAYVCMCKCVCMYQSSCRL